MNVTPSAPRRRRWAVVTFLLIALGLISVLSFGNRRDVLVVYCAHDAELAAPIIRRFERDYHIPVDVRYDTEATKSLGLVELILREKSHSPADVFWDNQLLGMMELKKNELLLPYRGPGFRRIPGSFKDRDGCWAGFAARFRVFIVNSNSEAIHHVQQCQAWMDQSPHSAAIAKPLYGSTRSHYTVLWNEWGRDRLEAWHDEGRRKGLIEVAGNAMVKNLVASGTCQIGWTDSDDFFTAKLNHQPVEMFPWRLSDERTICIPNSIGILRHTRHAESAKQFVDFVLSQETEVQLANSPARQVPLGSVPLEQIPTEVVDMREWVTQSIDWSLLGQSSSECLLWLRSRYAP